MKRFYSKVEVTAEIGIALDGKPVRTPGGLPLVMPNVALARAVAVEWEAQVDVIRPQTMPLTGLANAAIERIAPDRLAFAQGLAVFCESELLCYRADSPPELVARQSGIWDPILDWARSRYDVGFVLAEGIIHKPQPAETLARLAAAVSARSAFELAALSPIITISGSLVIGLALFENALSSDAAFDAGHLDELWQAELWGEDELACEQREARRADFLAAARFLCLVRG